MIKMVTIKKQQTNDIGTKPQNVFYYLKILSQEAKDLMDEYRSKIIDAFKDGDFLFKHF